MFVPLTVLILVLITLVSSFQTSRVSNPLRSRSVRLLSQKKHITDNVQYNTVAREWRLKWSPDLEKRSLSSVQNVLSSITPALKDIKGLKDVQRIVCGGCLDYKVIVSLNANNFGEWESNKFKPEEDFLSQVKAIPGVSTVETQTYTIEPVDL